MLVSNYINKVHIMDSLIGVIFPLHKNVIDFMFANKRDVFVKYTSHLPLKKANSKIQEGMTLYIYQSGGNKSIVGEALIKKYDYLDMHSILNKYRDRLIISEEDLKTYAQGREEKKALILELSDLRRYKNEIKLSKPITMAGLCLSEDRKNELFSTLGN